MSGKAVGFYWTLPVPWAGVTVLPDGIEEAAKASRTIRYQMELIRSYAAVHKLSLIREEAFLEVEPDRGTPYVLDVLAKLEAYCRKEKAALLYVDFSQAQGWRTHGPMRDWSASTGIPSIAIWPDEVMIDGKPFDPGQHFHDWRKRQHQWTAGKSERLSKAMEFVEVLRAQGMSYERIAASLNDGHFRSATGKAWTEEMVRKVHKASLR